MKNILSALLMMSLLITPSIASEDGDNPFAAIAPKITGSINYEPLEIEVIAVDAVIDRTIVKPWYQSKRLWMGVTIGTGLVAGVASLIYSLNGGDEDKGGNPLAISLSPIPSVIANMTATITATASALWSATRTARPSPAPAAPGCPCYTSYWGAPCGGRLTTWTWLGVVQNSDYACTLICTSHRNCAQTGCTFRKREIACCVGDVPYPLIMAGQLWGQINGYYQANQANC